MESVIIIIISTTGNIIIITVFVKITCVCAREQASSVLKVKHTTSQN